MKVIEQNAGEIAARDAAPSLQQAGRSNPLGATVAAGGVNFSVYSQRASRMDVLFFDREDDARPARVIPMDPANRTYHYWHVFVPGALPGPDLWLPG